MRYAVDSGRSEYVERQGSMAVAVAGTVLLVILVGVGFFLGMLS